MANTKQITLGFILMLLWSVTTAFSQVLTGSIDQHFQPVCLCFYVFSFTTVLFTLLNLKNIQNLARNCNKYKKDVGLMNLTTVGCWFLLIYPLKYLEPSIVGALYLGLAPIVSLFAGKFLYKTQKIRFSDYLVTFALLAITAYLANLCFGDHSAIKHVYSFNERLLALTCIFIGGITLGFNTLYTKRLSTVGFSPTDILTVRFLLLIFITGVFQLFINDKPILSAINIRDILAVAFGMIIVPQILFQNSINRIDPISTAVIALFMPVLTFFVEFADQRLQPNIWTIAGVMLIFIVAAIGATMRYKTEKLIQRNG